MAACRFLKQINDAKSLSSNFKIPGCPEPC
jgi:hypothetical protein